MNKTKIMLGNEAIARGAYEAGVKVSSAYPGTPSTEISENIVKYPEIYAEWAPNEKVAMEVAIGASISGVRAMASMKMVGVNVASDPLYTVSYIGANGGLVIAAADDPGLYSSQNEQDSRCVARVAQVPVLEPSDSQEAKDFTKLAFEYSEKYDTPVMIRTTTRLAHSQSPVTLEERQEIPDKPYERCAAKKCNDARKCKRTSYPCGKPSKTDGRGRLRVCDKQNHLQRYFHRIYHKRHSLYICSGGNARSQRVKARSCAPASQKIN